MYIIKRILNWFSFRSAKSEDFLEKFFEELKMSNTNSKQ